MDKTAIGETLNLHKERDESSGGGFPSTPLQITRRKHDSIAEVLSRADVMILPRLVRSCNTANLPGRIHKKLPGALANRGVLYWTSVQCFCWPGDQVDWPYSRHSVARRRKLNEASESRLPARKKRAANTTIR